MGEIEKICSAGGGTKLRELLFEPRTTNAFPSIFAVVFIAIFEAGIRRKRKISDYEGIKAVLRGINGRIQAGQKGSSSRERRTNIDVVKGVIEKFFAEDPNIGNQIYSNHKIVDIDSDIRRSEIELASYELKQGILPLDKAATDGDAMLDKLLRTICAIANNGPKNSGKIMLGVADKEADAKRAAEVDGVTGKIIGKRTVVGVNREAKRMGITTEAYAEKIVNHIKHSKLSEHTKGSVLSHLDFNSYFDLGVLILSIPPQRELTYLGDEIFRRNGSSNELVSSTKDIVEMSKRFQ